MPENQKTIYISVYEEINDVKTKGIMEICTAIIAQHNPDCLYFLFSSPGGYVASGITLYNFLKALPVKIIMHNIGSIDSIATVVFMAGEERYAAKHSSFLLHGVAVNLNAQRANISQIQEIRSSLEQDENKIAGIISDNTKLSDEEIRALFHQGESKDISFALNKGIIKEIRDPVIPKGELYITINAKG